MIGAGSGAAGTITVSGSVTNGSLVFNAAGSGTYTLTGGTLNLAGTVSNSVDVTINSVIGSGSLSKLGGGALTIGGVNAYSGATTIGAGTLKLGAAGVIPDASSVTATGTLDLNGNSETINALDGAGVVTNGGAAATLTAGSNGGGGAMSGVIVGPITLTKNGAGTLTFSGAGTNTYNGLTTVSAGGLTLNKSANVDAIGGNLAISGGTVTISTSHQIPNAATVTLNSGTLAVGGQSEVIGVTGNGGLVMNGGALTLGSGTINLTNAVITNGTVTVTAGGTIAAGNGLTFNGGTIDFNNTGTAALNLRGGSGITYQSSATLPAFITKSGGAGTATVDLNLSGVTTFAIDDSPGVATELTIAIPIARANAPIAKTGAGKLVLSGVNTYTGSTTVSNGTLALIGSGSIASSPAVVLSSGATFDVSGVSTPFTLGAAQTLSGSGTVTGSVTTVAGAQIVPGSSAGTLTFTTNLTLVNSTNYFELTNSFTVGSGVNDLIVVGGDLNVTNSTIAISNVSATVLAPGLYRLFNYSGTKNGSFNATPTFLSVVTVDGNPSIDESTPGQINLLVAASGVNGIAFQQQPTNGAAGTAFYTTVIATNSGGAGVSGASVTVSLFSGSGTLTGTLTRTTDGSGVATFNDLSLNKSGSKVLLATSGSKTNLSSAFWLSSAPATRLYTTLPGQAFTDGSGNSGTPNHQTAGVGFNIVKLTATDGNLNIDTNYSGAKTISYSGPGGNATYTTAVSFTAGVSTTTLATTLLKAESTAITATDGTLTGVSSLGTLVVDPGTYTKLQIIVPGVTAAPGTVSGKTGSPSAQAVGSSFSVTVNGVDANWNVVSNVDTVGITATDGGATLPASAALVAGTKAFSVTLNNTGTFAVTATNITNGSITSDSASILVTSILYRTKASGNWSDTNVWEVSTDNGSTWANTSTAPTASNSSGITITNGITVTVTNSVSADQFTVEAGATNDITASGILTIAEGTGTDMTVAGVLRSAGTVTTTGTLVFSSGGKYQHNWASAGSANLGVIPTATWSTGSTCEIIGFTSPTTKANWSTNAAHGLSQAFYNFAWNTPSLSTSVLLGGALTNIAGDFTFNGGDANSRLSLGSTVAGTNTLTVGGNMTVNGGGRLLVDSGTTTRQMIVQIGGNLTISSNAVVDGFGDSGTTFQFFGANSTYTRNTAINEDGTQQSIVWKIDAGAKVTLVNGSIVTGQGKTAALMYPRPVNVDGTLDLNGTTTNSFYTLSGASTGVITNSGAAVTLSVGGASNGVVTYVYSGVIAGGNSLALTKAGANTITLAGSSPNTYGGANTINAGILSVQKSGGLGTGSVTVNGTAKLQLTNGVSNNYINDSAAVSIASGAVIDLGFTGADDAVGTLTIAGTPAASGTWGTTASGAANIDDVHFSGTGRLSVSGGAPAITLQPTNYTALVNNPANFSAAASGTPAPVAQWQVSTNGGSTYNNLSGENANALSFTALGNMSGNKYRVVYTNTFAAVTSSVATLTVTCPSITVSPGTLPSGTTGVAYNQTNTASGGTAPYTFAKTSGTLPAGLTLVSTGELTGTPTNATTYNFTVTATDANGCTGSQTYSVTISCPTITVSPGVFPDGTLSVAYNQTNTASGGASPYTFAIASGTLPAGLTLATGGALTGTPTTVGTNNFTVRATDVNGCAGDQAYQVIIHAVPCPTITVGPASLPNASLGIAYSQTNTATGGGAPYVFTNISGSLPTGLTLSSNGVLSGTSTAAGVFSFTVRATDTNGCSGTQAYSITSSCPVITLSPGTLPGGVVLSLFSQTISASGGVGAYTFTNISGALPDGLTLSSSGLLSGTLATAATYNFTIQATDANGCSGTQAYTVTVTPSGGSDLIAPKVKILSPKKNAVVTTAPLTFTGTAADKVLVSAVYYWLDTTTNNPATGIASGTTSWSVVLPGAAAGAHTLTVVAQDSSGNYSAPASVVVHFGTNSFATLGGNYNGLFSVTGTNGFVHENSGSFSAKIKVKEGKLPTFSAKLVVDGNKLSAVGTFEMTGVGTLKKLIDRHTKYTKTDLDMVLNLPFDNSGNITGTVGPTNGAWSSIIKGYQVTNTSAYEGHFTMVVPGNPGNSANEPGGHGYGLVIVDATGVLKLAGSKLADGQNLGQKINLSSDGRWPLYSTASKDTSKATRSAIMGWLTWSNGAWAGTLTWDKQSGSSDARYTSGFTSLTEVVMSPYFASDPLANIILPYATVTPPATNAIVVFQGGGLTADLTNSVALSVSTGKNKFTTDKVRKMTLSVTAKTGKLAAGFLNPDDGLQKSKGFGVVLTNSASGSGYFLPEGNTQSGAFSLDSAP